MINLLRTLRLQLVSAACSFFVKVHVRLFFYFLFISSSSGVQSFLLPELFRNVLRGGKAAWTKSIPLRCRMKIKKNAPPAERSMSLNKKASEEKAEKKAAAQHSLCTAASKRGAMRGDTRPRAQVYESRRRIAGRFCLRAQPAATVRRRLD